MELGEADATNRFGFHLNDSGFKNSLWDQNQGAYVGAWNNEALTAWSHVIAVIDRSTNPSRSIIYINGTQNGQPKGYYFKGDWPNAVFHIGRRGNSLGFVGSLALVKIYNYPFTETEALNLYNSEK